MATYYTLLTKIGQARIANAVALNQMVNLTYMAVGDGNGNPTTPNENQTALVREKYRATINQLTVDPDNPNYLVAEMIVPTTVGGWSIYEVGVFDDQNQLIAVANFPATYKPELAEGSGRDLIVRIVIQVSNTSVVTLKIDPAITLASQSWVAANYVKKTTVAGGTTGQVLVKKSNANEDFQWVDQTAAVDVNVFSREETQTVSTGQTIIDLAQLTTDGAAIYIEGIRLRDDQFTVNSPTRLTLATSYPAGTKVTIVQNEETSSIVGRLINIQKITASGTYTPTLGTKRIKVTLTGGGGGGSSVIATSLSQTAFGGGGGSGSTCIGFFDISSISNFSVVIGSGGAKDTSGGTSTFNGMSAGHGGGGGGVNTPATGAGGAAGTATGGLINIDGGYGSDGQQGNYYSFGNGAASFWGGGGRAGSSNGLAARAYGAGGGAAYDTSLSGVLKNGGSGAPGVCVIEEYA